MLGVDSGSGRCVWRWKLLTNPFWRFFHRAETVTVSSTCFIAYLCSVNGPLFVFSVPANRNSSDMLTRTSYEPLLSSHASHASRRRVALGTAQA